MPPSLVIAAVMMLAMLLVSAPVRALKKSRDPKQFTLDYYSGPIPEHVEDVYDSTPPIHWMAPFFSGGGYASEAQAFVMAMLNRGDMIVTIDQHGDVFKNSYFRSLPADMQGKLLSAYQRPAKPRESVVVCHSEPGAWFPPKYPTSKCPPEHDTYYTVGRTMFETDRTPEGWSDRLNRMHEVWVPTHFQAEIFEDGGVMEHKTVVVPEPVDSEFFAPMTPNPLLDKQDGSTYGIDTASSAFKFFSVFKWEYRKGWDVLLEAFLTEFSADDDVVLYILTSAYHSTSEFDAEIAKFVEDNLAEDVPDVAARVNNVKLVDTVPQDDLPAVYQAMDCFVLPSRGEGWGRPHVEAMSMELPVIATNWSGPTEFMTDANSYPLRFDSMEPIPEGAFKGHLMAEPSVEHLQELMRHVFDNQDEAVAKGKVAREDMVQLYHPSRLAEFVLHQMDRIKWEKRHPAPEATPAPPKKNKNKKKGTGSKKPKGKGRKKNKKKKNMAASSSPAPHSEL